jgi:hypothetical protein
MGLEIHAINESDEDSMVRHFSIWNYRRCVALSGYMIDALSKEELEHEFRQTADLQLYSEVKIDDDDNYIDPISKLNDAEEESFPVKVEIEKETKHETTFLYVNTLRDEDGTPTGCIINCPKELFKGIPRKGLEAILTCMVKQTRGTEELLFKIFKHENKKRGMKGKEMNALARTMARNASETDDTVLEGTVSRYIGLTLSRGMLRYIQDELTTKERTYIQEMFEQWEDVGSLASFNGVWLQIANEQKFKIK